MKEENFNMELDTCVEYAFNQILKVITIEIEDDTEEFTFMFDKDEISELKVNKEDIVNMICAKIEECLSESLIFDRFDDNGDPCFKISDFQKHKISAYNKLKKSYRDNIAYLKDYKYLIVSCEFGIIGEISNIEMNQIHEAAYMVYRLNCMYGWISSSFAMLKDLYFKEYDV